MQTTMSNESEAVYENGALRPLVPLPLSEFEQVTVAVSRAADDDWLDAEFMSEVTSIRSSRPHCLTT
jgi:predicted DNA-binding antitoxin AbrB/MazE fold protein